MDRQIEEWMEMNELIDGWMDLVEFINISCYYKNECYLIKIGIQNHLKLTEKISVSLIN